MNRVRECAYHPTIYSAKALNESVESCIGTRRLSHLDKKNASVFFSYNCFMVHHNYPI